MSPESQSESPILDALREQIDALSIPQGDERNQHHFVLPDGSVEVRCLPWLDPGTGEVIGDEPKWMQFFPTTSLTKAADFVVNLPDSNNEFRGRLLKNPLTGKVVNKMVPWVDYEDSAFVFDEYRPGLEVSRGKQISYTHNPDQEFDDPNDIENIRFISRDSLRRNVSSAFVELDMERGRRQRGFLTARAEAEPELNKVMMGLNLGGTVVMKSTTRGLTGTQGMDSIFAANLKRSFPHHIYRSIGIPLSKLSKKDAADHGLDSSQMQIDILGDAAIAMVSTWNSLSDEERKVFAGFTVSLGSDSSVESMSYLKMMLGSNCPFSVIGIAAMKPAGAKSSDALPNLRKAHEHLADLHEQGLTTVALRLEGGLYDPTQTVKLNDKKATAFVGRKMIDTEYFETVETVDQSQFYKVQDEDYKKPYEGALILRGDSKTMYIPGELSKNIAEMEDQIERSSTKAIILETYASFTLPANVLQAAKRASKGRPIFCVNPIPSGKVDHEYEVTKALTREEGVYALGMTPHATRVKLNYAIRLFGDDQEKIVDFMTRNNFVGEQYEGFEPLPRPAIEQAEVLKKKLYEKLGITEELVQRFESDGYREDRIATQTQTVLTDLLNTALSSANRLNKLRVIFGRVRKAISGLVDQLADSEDRLYMLHMSLERMTPQELIRSIQDLNSGIGQILYKMEPNLTSIIPNQPSLKMAIQ